MSVGGYIIEIRPMVLVESGTEVVRLWCMETNGDEICVYAQPASVMPQLGDHVWWSSAKLYFDHDRRHLNKVGYSFSAPRKETRKHERAP